MRERHAPDRYTPNASPSIFRHSPRYISHLAQCNRLHLTYWNNPSAFIDASCVADTYAFAAENIVRMIQEPGSYKEAMNGPHAKQWRAACDVEMENFSKKGVWHLVDRPSHKAVIKGRWVFKIKLKEDGTISKFKARYVAKGFSQVPGVDYSETFSPTGKPASFRVLIALAAANGYSVHQMDAVAAFLNNKCTEELYLELPDGFSPDKTKVARLDRTLYGLKQSARVWSDDVASFLCSNGFTQSAADPCIFVRISPDKSKFSALYVHVDDMAITGNEIESVKAAIAANWEMEDLGLAHCVVGIQIRRLSNFHYCIGQPAMIETVLTRFGMFNCKSASTPFPADLKLRKASPEEAALFAKLNLPYRSGVGSLIYIAQFTRPDISYAVGVLSQHLENPGRAHWDAFIHVLRYLKGTQHLFIHYNANTAGTVVQGNQSWASPAGYSDADWAGDKSTRRSTTGYLFKIMGGAISWRSKLQPTVALSSTEAEYRATTEAGQETVWLRRLLFDFSYEPSMPTTLHCDNLGAIQLTSKSIFHARTKHVEIHYHFIRELVQDGIVELKHCLSKYMVADILTKPLGKSPFQHLRSLAGLIGL